MSSESYRIKHALYLPGWEVGDDESVLADTGTPVTPTDYDQSMDDELFCPRCHTPLTRKPKDKPFFSNGRLAGFSHLPSYRDVPCTLRSTIPEGQLFTSETEALEAIGRRDLVVVSDFMKEQPQSPASAGIYDQSQVFDETGPVSSVSLRRHDGPEYNLPTRNSSVAALCRGFASNLSRYYLFPGQHVPKRLEHQLIPVTDVKEESDEPKLYWGVIRRSDHMGQSSKQSWHQRMTYLKCAPGVKDFCLKDIDGNQKPKGIGDTSVGRVLIAWSRVRSNGIGLCFLSPRWGAYALLPEKYNQLLLSS